VRDSSMELRVFQEVGPLVLERAAHGRMRAREEEGSVPPVLARKMREQPERKGAILVRIGVAEHEQVSPALVDARWPLVEILPVTEFVEMIGSEWNHARPLDWSDSVGECVAPCMLGEERDVVGDQE